MDHTLRAGEIARAAADALALIDLGHAVGAERDGAEAAGIDARAAARAAVGAQIVALGALVGAAAAVAVDAGDLGGEFFLNDHVNCLLSSFPLIGRTGQRQAVAALTVELIIRLCDGRSGRNRGDLADADGTAGNLQTGLIEHQRLDLRHLMCAEQAERAEFGGRFTVRVDLVFLRQRKAHRHDDAALDLALAGQGVDGLADIVRGDHFFH